MPDRERKPVSVYESTHSAIKAGAAYFDDVGSYDEFIRKMLVKFNDEHEFLESGLHDALKKGERGWGDE